MTDFQIIKQAPLTFVGATNIGALFFGYCGSVAGNNEIGLVFNSTSFMLSRPIKSVEITLTSLIFRPISHITGLSLVLNGLKNIVDILVIMKVSKKAIYVRTQNNAYWLKLDHF